VIYEHKEPYEGDFHVRFRENVGVKFPCVTRLAVIPYNRTKLTSSVNGRKLNFGLILEKKAFIVNYLFSEY
jgi:hypothetical protein